MRKSAEWMSVWDDRILEYVLENGSGSPTEIINSGYVHVSRQHVSRRMSKLAEEGLLNSLGNGIYQINKRGQQYLIGNFDVKKEQYINTDLSDINFRNSNFGDFDEARVIEIKMNAESEEEAIIQLQNQYETLGNLLTPVLLQIKGTGKGTETKENNFKVVRTNDE